jgi:cytochrome c553
MGATLLLLALPAAQAQDVRALQAASLAAGCTGCHGTEGRALAESRVPGLAGQSAEFLATRLKAFKTGARTGTVMNQISKGYSDMQIEQLATWFAAQKE